MFLALHTRSLQEFISFTPYYLINVGVPSVEIAVNSVSALYLRDINIVLYMYGIFSNF